MPKLLIEYVSNYFKENGCELLSTEYNNCRANLEYIAQCGHKNNVSFNSFKSQRSGRKCKNCIPNRRLNLDYVKKYFEDEKCTLLSTEYVNDATKLEYVAQCGHTNRIVLNSFKTGCGRECFKCCRKNKRNYTFEQNKEIYGDLHSKEARGIKLLLNLVDLNYFEIYDTYEGCRADLLIKPKNKEKWLRIQVKTTEKKIDRNCYQFNHVNNYEDYLLICICLTEQLFWIIDGNICKNLKTLKFTKNSKKWGKYLITNREINDKIIYFYENMKKVNIEEGLFTILESVRKEIQYNLKRKKLLNWLTYNKVETECSSTDIIINGFKIQDKLAYIDKTRKNEAYRCDIKKHYQQINYVGKRVPYSKGDNDYYWFFLPQPFENLFYIIPERELIDNEYIKTDDCKGRSCIFLYPKGREDVLSFFCQKYLFNYNEIDEDTKIFL